MRIVLDTNVLARAVGSPAGPAAELFERIAAEHVLGVSSELLAELSRVLGYERAIEIMDDVQLLVRLRHGGEESGGP